MRFESQEWTDGRSLNGELKCCGGHSFNGELQICGSLFPFTTGTGLDWNLPIINALLFRSNKVRVYRPN